MLTPQVVMATGPMFANIHWGTYALFAALNGVVIFPTVYLFFPETKRYSLEDVSGLLLSLITSLLSAALLPILPLHHPHASPDLLHAPCQTISSKTDLRAGDVSNFGAMLAETTGYTSKSQLDEERTDCCRTEWFGPNVQLTIQLDIIFALAHDEGKNPVWVSKSGQIPEAGSPEAEAILGRATKTEKADGLTRRLSVSRMMSREKDKRSTAQHNEQV